MIADTYTTKISDRDKCSCVDASMTFVLANGKCDCPTGSILVSGKCISCATIGGDGTIISASVCKCPTTHYWNATNNKCETCGTANYLIAGNQNGNTACGCVGPATWTNNKCICPTTHVDTGSACFPCDAAKNSTGILTGQSKQ